MPKQKTAKKVAKTALAKPRKKRQHYTAAKQAEVLSAAQKENLTARQVQQRFDVTPVTYYSWRKKAKLPPAPRGRRPGSASKQAGRPAVAPKLATGEQQVLRSQVRRIIDGIVRDEVRKALAEIR